MKYTQSVTSGFRSLLIKITEYAMGDIKDKCGILAVVVWIMVTPTHFPVLIPSVLSTQEIK